MKAEVMAPEERLSENWESEADGVHRRRQTRTTRHATPPKQPTHARMGSRPCEIPSDRRTTSKQDHCAFFSILARAGAMMRIGPTKVGLGKFSFPTTHTRPTYGPQHKESAFTTKSDATDGSTITPRTSGCVDVSAGARPSCATSPEDARSVVGLTGEKNARNTAKNKKNTKKGEP